LNRQWQALAQFLRGSRRLSLRKIRVLFGPKLGGEKPSLIVAIGKRRKGNALEEYRRRFASPAGQRSGPMTPLLTSDKNLRGQPAQPERSHAKRPERSEEPKRPLRSGTRRRRATRLKAGRSGGSSHFYGAAWTLLRLALLRGYYGVTGIKPGRGALIGVTMACAIALGGAYVYKTVTAGGEVSTRTSYAAQSLDKKPGIAESIPSGNKRFYDRLTSDASETVTASLAVPAGGAGQGAPPSVAPVYRADEQSPEGEGSANAPAPSQPVATERRVGDQPTVVRSERYLADGTRTDIAPPAPVSGVVKLGTEQARPAFAAAEPPAALDGGPAPQTTSAPAVALPVQAAEPVPSSDNGYYAQVKSDQDVKAAEAELAVVMEKYKAVLGDVPLLTRSVDLKAKGVWIRVVAGPLKSRDEAESLCKKLKSAGLQACIVQKFD
jgi:SPOR domain